MGLDGDRCVVSGTQTDMDAARKSWVSRYRGLIRVALGVYFVALFFGTHYPIPEEDISPKVPDKLLHFLAFVGLAYLLAFWCSTKWSMSTAHYAILFTILITYGAVDEFSQKLPYLNRTADVNDWLMDLLGSVIGLTAFHGTRLVISSPWKSPEQPSNRSEIA